jgi:malate dehydrogenase (oxaloacetate-decarboxylating)
MQELDIPVMHDDQHGTAVVVLAGLINALKIKRQKKEDVNIVINGAGSAGLSITNLLLKYGFKNIVVLDSKGAIYKGRGDLNNEKKQISILTNKRMIKEGLDKCLIGADIFVGVSKPRVLTRAMVETMNSKPVIFALANPEPEIMPDEAKKGGAYIVATGRSDFPNQINNALAFPGIFRGALDNKIKQFNDQMFIKAAEALALATKKISKDRIIPDPFDKGLASKIARVIK